MKKPRPVRCVDCGKSEALNMHDRCERCEVARRNAAQHVERLVPPKKRETASQALIGM